MQCYTRAHQYPKTTVLSHFPAPPLEAYRKRHFFVPEPTKIGRPWCPGGVVMPAPLQHIKRVQFNPVNELHREEHMNEMLDFINKTNWTCGQDMLNFGGRKFKYSDSVKFSLQSTQRSHYPGHWMGIEPRRNPSAYASAGASPTAYHVLPYPPPQSHPFVLRQALPDELVTEGTNEKSVLLKVPHYIMEPYPGPQIPEHLRKRVQERATTGRMGLVP